MDIAAPPNTPVTALLSGWVSSITSPRWGRQVCIHLESRYNDIPYMAYLHLSAVEPHLTTQAWVNRGDVIGWVGGGTRPEHYQGTSNPTGQNFLNDSFMSSRIQVGIALMRGPEYGTGLGWSEFPPIDRSLDPTQLILDARKRDMHIPQGWKDDGTTLTAPNDFIFVRGFRQHIISDANWPEWDYPLENEHAEAEAEESNLTIGPGSVQVTRLWRLVWTPKLGVYRSWLGQEYLCVKAERDHLKR